MKHEDDGLGPNSWDRPGRRFTIRKCKSKFGYFLQDCWWVWCDWWLVVVSVGFVAGLVWLMVYVAVEEQRQWNEFTATHVCKVVAKKRGEVFTTTGIGANGQVVIGTSSTSDQTAYQCDDGVTYWR